MSRINFNTPDSLFFITIDNDKELATIRKHPNTYSMWLEGLDFTYFKNIIKTIPEEHRSKAVSQFYAYHEAKLPPPPTEIPESHYVLTKR